MTSIRLTTSDISVIIPAVDEAPHIGRLAGQLTGQAGEIILVDGGSRDETARLAGERGFTVYTSRPGRAAQMNLGASRSRGAILLFLHADTRLPPDFGEQAATALTDERTALCAFALEIDTDNPVLRLVAAAANLRSRLAGLPYGDQALSLRRETFFGLGGFPDLPIMEDFVLVRAAARRGRIRTLPAAVRTSARRWQRLGILQTTLINQFVVAGFKLGVPPEKLASLYRNGLFRRR